MKQRYRWHIEAAKLPRQTWTVLREICQLWTQGTVKGQKVKKDFNGGYLVQKMKASKKSEAEVMAILREVASGKSSIKEAVVEMIDSEDPPRKVQKRLPTEVVSGQETRPIHVAMNACSNEYNVM